MIHATFSFREGMTISPLLVTTRTSINLMAMPSSSLCSHTKLTIAFGLGLCALLATAGWSKAQESSQPDVTYYYNGDPNDPAFRKYLSELLGLPWRDACEAIFAADRAVTRCETSWGIVDSAFGLCDDERAVAAQIKAARTVDCAAQTLN
jgi:hypothetical protein